MKNSITIALAGNPNSGKTSLFNNITGSRQKVGNYPGVTVEKKTGTIQYNGENIEIVDLPGTYSLTAHTIDEIVARDFVLNEKPDVVINVIDSTNLERSLYLTVQFLELGIPVVLALNMSDEADAMGLKINIPLLSKLIGAPAVRTIGNKNKGTHELLNTALHTVGKKLNSRLMYVSYGTDISTGIRKLTPLIRASVEHTNPEWLALKLLEGDSRVQTIIREQSKAASEIFNECIQITRRIKNIYNDSVEEIIAEKRYGFISGACTEAVATTVERRHTVSDKIDIVLTHPFFGLAIFGGFMFLLFHLTFTLGEAPMGWIENAFAWLSDMLNSLWAAHPDSMLRSVLVDGIIAGVGGVMVFLPNIILLFLGIAVLEDTGYMSRAAFIMDRFMHMIGLHGKSFIPMLIGFGCTVPAVMATRTLENKQDRILTMLATPLMSCGAKLPVYIILIGAFFPVIHAGKILFSIYIIGVLLAVVVILLFKKLFFKGLSTPFVIELPPYRIPTIKSIVLNMLQKAGLYVRKAGTIILAASVLLWVLLTFPQDNTISVDYDAQRYIIEQNYTNTINGIRTKNSDIIQSPSFYNSEPYTGMINRIRSVHEDYTDRISATENNIDRERAAAVIRQDELKKIANTDPAVFAVSYAYYTNTEMYHRAVAAIENNKAAALLKNSYAGNIGRFIEPIIAPLGFDWKVGIALLSGAVAKEVIVSTMGTVYSIADADEQSGELRAALRADKHLSPLAAYSLMIFVLLYIPCIAAMGIIIREAGWKWGIFTMVYTLALAWIMSFIVYQGGMLVGLG